MMYVVCLWGAQTECFLWSTSQGVRAVGTRPKVPGYTSLSAGPAAGGFLKKAVIFKGTISKWKLGVEHREPAPKKVQRALDGQPRWVGPTGMPLLCCLTSSPCTDHWEAAITTCGRLHKDSNQHGRNKALATWRNTWPMRTPIFYIFLKMGGGGVILPKYHTPGKKLYP